MVGLCLLLLLAAVCATLLAPGTRAPVLSVVEPHEGQRVGPVGLPVLVRFEPGAVAPDTLRVLLNGADVTSEFETASTGAHARLHGLLDGVNVLSIQAFGPVGPLRDWLLPSGTFRQWTREVHVLHRRPLDIDRG